MVFITVKRGNTKAGARIILAETMRIVRRSNVSPSLLFAAIPAPARLNYLPEPADLLVKFWETRHLPAPPDPPPFILASPWLILL